MENNENIQTMLGIPLGFPKYSKYPRIISRNASIKYHRAVIPSGVTGTADFNLH